MSDDVTSVEDSPSRAWHAVWERKGAEAPRLDGAADLTMLAKLAGYDSRTSALDLGDYYKQIDYVVEVLGITQTDTVYEVGCGAGCLLYTLQERCRAVGGADFAESLIGVARSVLDSDDLDILEARDVPSSPQYDVVLSNGVFIYFPDESYARDVLRAMLAKARRAVGVFDLNDAATRQEYEAERRRAQGAGAASYQGLDQLFLGRDFFTSLAAEWGVSCVIQESVMTGSINGLYRYNAMLYKDSGE